MKKMLFGIITLLVAMLAMTSAVHATPVTQRWNESGDGLFDAIGTQVVSGSDFDTTALTFGSGATGWSEISNATVAFASFDTTSSLDFFTNFLTSPAKFIFYAWDDTHLIYSALVDGNTSSASITRLYSGVAPSRAEFFARASAVPEPGILALFGFGLLGIGIVTIRRKTTTTSGMTPA